MELEKTIVNSEKGFGIVLSGGGAWGSYEAGVIKALNEYGIKFKLAAGTSVGALNASMVAADETAGIIRIWENISSAKVLKGGISGIMRGSIYDNSPLEKLINEEINDRVAQKVINSQTKLMIVSSNIKNKKELIEEEFRSKEQIIKALLSSTAIPFIFPNQKRSENEILVDGGIIDNFPIKPAVKKNLCKTFFTVSLNGPDVEKEKVNYNGPLRVGMRVFNTIFTNSYLNDIEEIKEKIGLADMLGEIVDASFLPKVLRRKKDQKIIELYEQYKIYEGIKIIEINPSQKLPMRELDFSQGNAKKAIEMGYEDAKKILEYVEII